MVTLSDSKKSILYDQLKIIIILLVVLGHCCVMFSPDGAITVLRKSMLLTYVSTILYSFHIPCFFMVSGAVFSFNLQKGKYGVFSPFAKKKAVRLVIPYLIFGVFIVLPVLVICGLLDLSSWYRFFWNLICGDQVRHLWYLYDLFFIFLLFWPIRSYFTVENVKKALVVSFVVSLLFRSQPFGFAAYFQIGNIFYYQFYFLCGIFLDLFWHQLVSFFQKHWYLVLFSIPVLILSCFFKLFTLTDYLYAAAGIVLSVSFAMFLCERRFLTENRWWNLISMDSYGIYLFHPMIIYLIFYVYSQREVSVVFLFLLSFSVSLLASFFLTEFCRRAHLGFVIGEGRKKSNPLSLFKAVGRKK